MSWFVYLLQSVPTGRIYTGIALDPLKRLLQHNGERSGGAKSTRCGRPWIIVHTEEVASKSDALKREAAIKRMTRKKKLVFIPSHVRE